MAVIRRPNTNYVAGTGITIAKADNPSLDAVDVTISGSGSGGGAGITVTVTQTAHGFVVGNVLALSGSSYVKAKADTPANAEVVGIVDSVGGANTFVLRTGGHIAGLSGLTAGAVYFLSDTTAGALQATEPTTVGHVSKPLLVADSASSGYFFVWRGVQITTVAQQLFEAEWAGVMPTVTGPGLELRVPTVGGASATFTLQAMLTRVSVLGSSSSTFRVEKSAGGGVFTPVSVDSLTHTTTDWEKTDAALSGTVSSGDLLRIYFVAVGGQGGSYHVQLLGVH